MGTDKKGKHPPGNYNPKGPHGWFGKGSQYSDHISTQQEQIKRQQEEASKLNAEEERRREESVIRLYTKQVTGKAQKSYAETINQLESNPSLLKVDTSDTKAVVARAKELILARDSHAKDPACFVVAGAIGAIFDSQPDRVPYTCHIGMCEIEGRVTEHIEPFGHIWIESQGKIFESFPKYKNSQLGKHTSIDIIDVKKR